MPRPTDVVFRNYNELTYIAPEDILPSLPVVTKYPKKLLVNWVDDSPETPCEYWLLESGKTLRIPRPPLMRPSPSWNQQLLTLPSTPQKPRSSSNSKSRSRSKSKSKFNKSPWKKTLSPLISPLSPIKILKSASQLWTQSRPPPTPLISPCQSFCYPPLRSPSSPLSSRLKFWKRTDTKGDEAEEDGDATLTVDAPLSPGAEFERKMWKAERSRELRLRSSELLLDPEDESGFMDSNEEDGMTIETQSLRLSQTSPKSTKSSSSSSCPTRSLKYCHSRSRSSSTTLPPIRETTEPVEQQRHLRSPRLLPPQDPADRDLEIAFNKAWRWRNSKRPSFNTDTELDEHVQCPIFNYCGNLDWENHVICWTMMLYFYIPFCAPWTIISTLKSLFRWIPFFNSLVDLIIDNGGGTFLFLLSHLGFGLACILLFIIFLILHWPFSFIHSLIVFFFRCLPWYKFKYSVGAPWVLEEYDTY